MAIEDLDFAWQEFVDNKPIEDDDEPKFTRARTILRRKTDGKNRVEDLARLPLDQVTLRRMKERYHKESKEQEALSILRSYQKNPLLFWKNELGIAIDEWPSDRPPKRWSSWEPLPLWSKQREIVKAIPKYKKVAVKSGHGLGKTFIAGGIALYLHYVYHALGLTTAPIFRQVRRLLWGEIHSLYNNAPRPLGGKINQVSLESGDKWFIEGFATDKPEVTMAGFHEENIFVIIDEAGGVDSLVYDMLDTILTSENSFVLLIGNPVDPNSPFADAFKPGSGYHQITMSCYDCPNVRHKYNIYPKLVSWDWPDRMRRKYGSDDAWFRSRVLAEFPEDNTDVLIAPRFVQKALDNFDSFERDRVVSFGVDVAREGMDRTAIGLRWSSGRFEILESIQTSRITEIAGRVSELFSRYEHRAHEDGLCINVDDTGVGGGLTDILYDKGLPVNGIIGGEGPDEWATDEDAERFLNKRAQYYWRLKTFFEKGKVGIQDEDLAIELGKIEREYTTKDKIKIIDKAKIRKKLGGRSPDKADCMMLAFAKDSEDSNRELIRFI